VSNKIVMSIRAELERIKQQNAGNLQPEDIVRVASDPEHPLHGNFNWDDAEAAHGFRLIQAAGLIRRVKITMESGEGIETKTVRIRAFHSLPEDRTAGGGYRSIEDIRSDDKMLASLMHQAMRDLAAFRQRYAGLSELDGLMDAIDDIVMPSPMALAQEG
jgi:hypothetical protein